MNFRLNPKHPYAHAARLPDGDGPVDIDDLVRSEGDLEIEIGPGRGGFTFERCEAVPSVRMIGFEIRLKWAHLVNERLKKTGLGSRAVVLGEDAKRALARLQPSACASVIYLHFPDPWWKKRHEKRLVMADELLREVARLLKPGGAFFIQTDVEERAKLYAEYVAEFGVGLSPYGDLAGSPVMAENPYQARSPREHRAIADGLPIYRLRYQRSR